MTSMKPGSTLTTVMLSPVVGGLIQLWTDTGAHLWTVADPDGLTAVLGRGRIARTSMPDNRFREAGLFDAISSTLLLQEHTFALLEPVAPETNPWNSLQEFLSDVSMAAAQRGEFWVLELGGWDSPQIPYCFAAVMTSPESAVSVVETSPVPRGTGVWPDDVPQDQTGTSVSGPATEDSVAAASIFAAAAASLWNVQPWDLAITFGQLPSHED
ncbi:hypothetical protein QMK17_09630 [Rhodococcus sp. G-MC3]|uniref:hypothetical protein n=1 Tax=Rhodococcus sp. G-MC3 TaxID=3046209 RepID=UPI0024BABDCB|nr:hypothetical protein [Rhodococcus sp. G-MC3]MDJ0393590.1 hypothetical protein [Rhodococcus sp. G-MC3]